MTKEHVDFTVSADGIVGDCNRLIEVRPGRYEPIDGRDA